MEAPVISGIVDKLPYIWVGQLNEAFNALLQVIRFRRVEHELRCRAIVTSDRVAAMVCQAGQESRVMTIRK
jgi:hypothetical protein